MGCVAFGFWWRVREDVEFGMTGLSVRVAQGMRFGSSQDGGIGFAVEGCGCRAGSRIALSGRVRRGELA